MKRGQKTSTAGIMHKLPGGRAKFEQLSSRLSQRQSRPTVIRAIAALALLIGLALAVSALYARHLAFEADRRLDMERRQTARAAVAALQSMAPELSRHDAPLIEALQRIPQVGGLRFTAEPPKQSPTVQSLLDDNGRIVGWFSWDRGHPFASLLERLSPFLVLFAAGFILLLFVGFWEFKRLERQLSKTIAQLDQLSSPVMGTLTKHQLEDVFDSHLAAGMTERVVGFLVIDFGGLHGTDDHGETEDEDELLVEAASRIRSASPPEASVAHLRGARFGLVIPAESPDDVVAIAANLRDAASRPFWIDRVIQIAPNIGLAVWPRDGATRSELMERAHLALHASRQRGRGLVLAFSPDMAAEFEEKRFIKAQLSAALAARALDVHYQPIVKADRGAIAGVEALARWKHPSRGWIPPAIFVKVAEEAGLIDQLTEFVLRRAIADASQWPDLYVAINVSPVQIRDRRFASLLAEVLAENSFPSSRIVLEITESVLIDDPDAAKSRLNELRALGVKLAIDDFGAGYSSLSYLQQLPFDKLKIDQGFVAALNRSANAGVIIQAIVALGRALGLAVVVEGVETEEQRVLMRLAGCSEMQGYLFSKPVAREEIDWLLAEPTLDPRRAGQRQ